MCLKYCCECGNPVFESDNYHPDPNHDWENDQDAVPIIVFSEPIQFYHPSCFQMMITEKKVMLKSENQVRLFGRPL